MPGTRSAHLQMGVLTGIVVIIADLEIGATKRAVQIFAGGSGDGRDPSPD